MMQRRFEIWGKEPSSWLKPPVHWLVPHAVPVSTTPRRKKSHTYKCLTNLFMGLFMVFVSRARGEPAWEPHPISPTHVTNEGIHLLVEVDENSSEGETCDL
jgi:hypothetical protein